MDKYYQQISCILISNENMGGLYLGSMENARNKETLKQNSIKALLSVSHSQEFTHDGFIMKYIPLFDVSSQKLLYLQTNSQGKLQVYRNLHVHCQAGASRSAAIVIGFLMYWKGLDYKEAYHYVKTIRSFIQPNKGFVKELKIWELELLKVKTSKL